MRRMMDGPLVSVHSDWVETGPAEMEERVKYTCLKYRAACNFFLNKYLFLFSCKNMSSISYGKEQIYWNRNL